MNQEGPFFGSNSQHTDANLELLTLQTLMSSSEAPQGPTLLEDYEGGKGRPPAIA